MRRRISSGWRTVSVERRDTGHDDAEAEHAADFVGELDVSARSICSRFSIGGYIAQTLTVRHPELIRRLILAGTGPRAANHRRPEIRRVRQL